MERFSFQTTLHGAGGFGKVIRGRDNALDREIAVKVLSPLLAESSPPDQERFKREARTRARTWRACTARAPASAPERRPTTSSAARAVPSADWVRSCGAVATSRSTRSRS